MAMVGSQKSVIKRLFLFAVVLFSMMFGMLLHAYAWGSETHPTGAADSSANYTAAANADTSVQTASFPKQTQTVDVCRGDTLSSIAAAHRPKGEGVYSYMNKIKKANGLHNSDLKEGQILILP